MFCLQGTLSCGFDGQTVNGGVPLPSTYHNPCSPDSVNNGIYFFAYADDKHRSVFKHPRYLQSIRRDCGCEVWNLTAETKNGDREED